MARPAAHGATVAMLLLAFTLAPGFAGAEASGTWDAIGGFLRSLFGRDSPDECVFKGVALGQVEAGARDVVVPVKKKAWEQSVGGEEAAKPFVQALLRGWPSRALVARDELPTDDGDFLRRLAADVWRGLDAFTNQDNGLPIDNVRFHGGSVDVTGATIGDYTNITNVGLFLIAVTAARDLALISDDDAVARIRAILDTLGGLEKHDGFLFNYYDVTSLERTSNLVSFVDSSWLSAGLIVVRASFPELRERCSKLIETQDYRFFYDPDVGQMSHGYYVHLGARSRYHYGVLYAESRLGSLIAIGRGDALEEHWFRMARTFPAACDWQTRTPHHREEKSIDGIRFRGGFYEWEEFDYVPSWGGSMFEALMPTLVLDEARYAPASLGANDRVHVAVHRRWALEHLGYPVWGMSSCSTPDGYGYHEFGVEVLGLAGYGAGAVTPHASALALSVAPHEAAANLHRIAELYDAYGDFGLYDSVDPLSGEVAHTYLTLDQAMTFIALANHLTGGAIQQAFASDPIVQKALPVIAKEDFFD